MSRVIASFSRGIFILLFFGIMLLVMDKGVFFVSIKPATSFEDLLDKEPKSGMHVKGEVAYAFDCFAKEETWTERSDGSRTAKKNSNYYYAIPGYDTIFAVEIPADEYKQMEQLADETYEFLYSGAVPTTKIFVDGVMKKMDKDTEKLFKDYLRENDFTEEEIEAWGPFLIVDQYSMGAVRVMFLLGVALVALAVFFFVRNYKKQAPQLAEPQLPPTGEAQEGQATEEQAKEEPQDPFAL